MLRVKKLCISDKVEVCCWVFIMYHLWFKGLARVCILCVDVISQIMHAGWLRECCRVANHLRVPNASATSTISYLIPCLSDLYVICCSAVILSHFKPCKYEPKKQQQKNGRMERKWNWKRKVEMEIQSLSCCILARCTCWLSFLVSLTGLYHPQYFCIGKYWGRQWLRTRLLYPGRPVYEAITCFTYCKRSNLEVGKGLETRLHAEVGMLALFLD